MTFRRINRGKYHTYELDGRKLPGVTTLIRNGVPKPNLIDWAARSAAEFAADHIDEVAALERDAAVDLIKSAHRRSTTRAAVKGSDVHDLAAKLRVGGDVEVPDALAGFVDAYLTYLDDWSPKLVAIERPLVNHRWRYGGTFDELAVVDGRMAVVDIKSGATGVWPETCLQVAAYRSADTYLDNDGNEVPMPTTQAGFALWLSDDGRYELVELESGPDVFAAFLHAAYVAVWMDRDRDDVIGLPMVPTAAAS